MWLDSKDSENEIPLVCYGTRVQLASHGYLIECFTGFWRNNRSVENFIHILHNSISTIISTVRCGRTDFVCSPWRNKRGERKWGEKGKEREKDLNLDEDVTSKGLKSSVERASW